ncbi:response regulator [Sphingobacterium faecium]|uniref:response regulator n=1 Tax=Sphingobacterium faecium TaxID=34087 RepID=UPI003207E6D6
MKKELQLLYVEDDKENRENLIKVLSDDEIGDYKIKIEGLDSFEGAIDKISANQYHIIILDLFLGNPQDKGREIGIDILKAIQEKYFVPVIFFSGNTKNVEYLKSQIVGIATKGDGGIDALRSEIERLIKFNLPFIKENLHNHIEEELKTYFWDIIHNQRDKFKAEDNDFSLGYLMLRKFGHSLSKNKISEILGDDQLKKDKVHPMEFYIYPTDSTLEVESGELLEKDGNVYVVLTPSCDFVERFNPKTAASLGRKVGKILITKTKLLVESNEFLAFKANSSKENSSKLEKLVTSSQTDRYFFLPGTPFVDNRFIDFQDKLMIEYEELKNFNRLTKLDNPFAEGMIASFIRYYNRIGYPDIDSEYVISNL